MKLTKKGKNTLATIGGILLGCATALSTIKWEEGFTPNNIMMAIISLVSFLGGFLTTFKGKDNG